jgi:putative ABC transport system ATP-binding protein
VKTQVSSPAPTAASSEPSIGRQVLSARSLVYSYDHTHALRGVSLDIDAGEILAVTGPSGSGKSTLMLCLAGVLRPDAGEVSFSGHRISDWNESERSRLRRSAFGILFQFGQLVPELTAAENVALPLLLSGVKRTPAVAAATTWLERFGVAEQASSRPPAMSGGQAQRVAAARAMVTEPSVLFADEPTVR